MAVRLGPLDRRVSIEYKSIAVEAVYGTDVVTWVLLALGDATVEYPLAGRTESVRQGIEVARDQVTVTMRYRSDVDSNMRLVVHGGGDETYRIVSGPTMMGRQEGLMMICEKFTSDG